MSSFKLSNTSQSLIDLGDGVQLGGDNISMYPLPVTVKFVAASAGQTANVSGNIFRKI